MDTTTSAHTAPTHPSHRTLRARWAAIGAAIAVSLGAGGGFGLAHAVQSSGERATYTAITPCRLTDTRPGDDNVGPRATPITAGETVTIDANAPQGRCEASDYPDDAGALQLNVTAVNATVGSFLTFWPDGTMPLASSLNPTPGQPPAPNAVPVELTAAQSFKMFNNAGSVDVIIDVVGFYTDHNHDDRYYTKAEIDAAGAPLKDQVYVIDFTEFTPYNLDGTGKARSSGGVGVYIPGSAGNNQLYAPLHLPTGATITAWQASVIDKVSGTGLNVEFRVNGVKHSEIDTSGSSPNTQILGSSDDYTVIAGNALTFRAESFGSSTWTQVTDNLQVVKIVIIYDEAGA